MQSYGYIVTGDVIHQLQEHTNLKATSIYRTRASLEFPRTLQPLDFKIKVGQTTRYWFNRENKAVVGSGRKQSKRR